MPAHHLDHSRFVVAPGRKVKMSDFDPTFTDGFANKAEAEAALRDDIRGLADSQELLWASGEYSVLVILQAMDAAGKDGAIKHVMTGVNPQGCDVFSFGPPSEEERRHHFLWRPSLKLPPRGRIAIFNRSYYEEVLVVRVHPELLDAQWLSPRVKSMDRKDEIWESRFHDINNFEHTLVNNGVCLIKIYLNLSRGEQRKRFLKRLHDPEKHWKFSTSDLRERGYWKDYMHAYEQMLSATSTSWAPWYVVPADHKWFTRACVADIISRRIQELKLAYPQPSPNIEVELREGLRLLQAEKDD